ncbi:hypothetical protein PsorP6_011741 [Peronosclerospora sorghi]|uniref:Uncharacterized protein n=1 Tax=Peronosclerospora sorghi TaxID=230839 RepID=A0ACC0WHM9_9STRA|nr:hypothetical protein PsorP6_011741 [Peronosclerospora sorghi]
MELLNNAPISSGDHGTRERATISIWRMGHGSCKGLHEENSLVATTRLKPAAKLSSGCEATVLKFFTSSGIHYVKDIQRPTSSN